VVFVTTSPSTREWRGTGYIQGSGQNQTVLESYSRRIEVLAWVGIGGIFLASLLLGPGYAINSLYSVSILLAFWIKDARTAYRLAAVSTILLAASTFLTGVAITIPVVLSRVTVALTIWLTAFVVTRYRESGAALREAQKALGRSVRDLEHIKYALDQSAIVAITDVKGEITFVNDKFCEISKYTREELLGQNHRIVNSGYHSIEFFKDMFRTIGAGRVWRAEIRNRAKDGSFYWVDTTIVPSLDDRGKPYQYIAIRYDVTERKGSEAALRAQTALVQLGKMAAIVAHEVRNPLAGIRGAMQVIGRRLPPGTAEHGVIKEVVTRIDTLNEIVQDLLLFARPRQPVFASVPLAGLLRETVSLLKEDPKFAAVSIVIDATDAPIVADPEQLKLVLLNLLINSAQAMEGKGEIHSAARTTNGWHELRIIDQGPGIPADAREHLFEPFFTTKHRGTGLGLATARRIIESHGGTLDLLSPPAGGTTAVVRLPVR